MGVMNRLFRLLKGFDEVIFPSVCLGCGIERTLFHQYICPFCLSNGFEDANPKQSPNASGEILPEGVFFQDALWKYHKGGGLQQLMHHLKYDYKAGLGEELGVLAANRCIERDFFKQWVGRCCTTKIVPVPLHPAKLRTRGFNQARKIGKGAAKILGMDLIEPDQIKRVKSTITQTGFSLRDRIRNMDSAFYIKESAAIADTCHLIIDDVFTTGTTVFELAQQLRLHESGGIGILTVAQA